MNDIQIQDPKVIFTIFPTASYPVLYKSYWDEVLNEENRVKNNTTGDQLEALQGVFRTYYSLVLNSSTLIDYNYLESKSPHSVIIVINYLTIDGIKYMWEYLDNWIGLIKANE